MKRTSSLLVGLFLPLLAVLPTGCDSGENHVKAESHEESSPPSGVTFNAKSGLRVLPQTAQFIGLKVADVEERKIAGTIEFSAQVYRSAGEAKLASLRSVAPAAALASGNISPTDAATLVEGTTVSIYAVQNRTPLPGRIVALSRDLERANGQTEVLLWVSDPEQTLTNGAILTIIVPIGGEKTVVGVPRSALLRTTEGDFVYTVSGDRFVRTAVKLGAANHEFAEVVDGLYAGDQIVLDPVMTLWMAELQSLRGGKACADGH